MMFFVFVQPAIVVSVATIKQYLLNTTEIIIRDFQPRINVGKEVGKSTNTNIFQGRRRSQVMSLC